MKSDPSLLPTASVPFQHRINRVPRGIVPIMGAAQETELIDGQRCQTAVVTCLTANAITSFYTVWRATGLNNLPLEIEGNIGSTVLRDGNRI